MLYVVLLIIMLSAVVHQDTQENLLANVQSQNVRLNLNRFDIYSTLNFYNFLVPAPTKESGNPCIPSPCGPNSQCRVIDTQPACSCLPNFIGRPPNCRPECINDSECPNNLACKNGKCRDPCPGSCGINAQCTVINHSSVCSCFKGYTGDPISSCILLPPCKIHIKILSFVINLLN